MNIFNMDCMRKIERANYSYYSSGALHPDRVMRAHDILYIMSGSWAIGQEDVSYELFPEDVIVLTGGRHHYGAAKCSPGTKLMFVHVLPEPGDRFVQPGEKTKPGLFPEETRSAYIPVVTHAAGQYRVKQLFVEIITEYWSRSEARKVKAEALINLLLAELHLIACETGYLSNDIASRVFELVRSEPSHSFSLQEIAGKLNVSTRTLTKRFRNETGKTIHEYQNGLKLEMARSLIQDPANRIPLKEVAETFGFYDEFHLSRSFKKEFGVSPSIYKKLG